MIYSTNEWDPLRSIVVGSAQGAHWPTDLLQVPTAWTDSPIPQGPVPDWIIEETQQDLQGLVDVLQSHGVQVHRPCQHDFSTTQGMYNYCPRDRLLIVGDVVIDCAMMMRCRDQEIDHLRPMLEQSRIVSMPRDQGMILDAANVCRINNTLLMLLSSSGNQAAANWLCEQFPDHEIEVCDFYSGVHIDSTLVPLREGVVALNAARVSPDQVPKVFKDWQHVWIDDCVPQSFYKYPYASKWIGMNMLALDPSTVIVERSQQPLMRQLERLGFTVIDLPLRHSRTLGGGFHCVTLDLWRQQ